MIMFMNSTYSFSPLQDSTVVQYIELVETLDPPDMRYNVTLQQQQQEGGLKVSQ